MCIPAIHLTLLFGSVFQHANRRLQHGKTQRRLYVRDAQVSSGQPILTHSLHDTFHAPHSDCVGGIIGVDSNTGFPDNLAIIGDIFLKSCERPEPFTTVKSTDRFIVHMKGTRRSIMPDQESDLRQV